MRQYPRQPRAAFTAWAMAGLIAISVGILLFPMPRITRIDDEIGNLLHAPCFAILALVCCASCRQFFPSRPIVLGVAIWLMLSVFGLLSEWLQGFVTRSPSWKDVAANIAGITAGVVWSQSREFRQATTRRMLRLAAIMLVAVASMGPALAIHEYWEQSRTMPLLASFERRRELQHWTVQNGRISRAKHRFSRGNWSMRLDLFPARWPGAILRPVGDWSGYKELVFESWLDDTELSKNPASGGLDMIVKVTDAAHNGETEDRFHRTIRLTSHNRTFRIPLAEIRDAPAAREMDLAHIAMLQFFIVRPQRTQTIWFDNIHVE